MKKNISVSRTKVRFNIKPTLKETLTKDLNHILDLMEIARKIKNKMWLERLKGQEDILCRYLYKVNKNKFKEGKKWNLKNIGIIVMFLN